MTENSKFSKLMFNDTFLWLGGSSCYSNYPWGYGINNNPLASYGGEGTIRPVLSLKAKVRLSENNTGDGSSSSSAYAIQQ